MKTTLLIVDDDEDIRAQLKWALSQEYEVLVAADAPSAAKAFKEARPSVVVVDLGLPPQPNDPGEGLALTSELLAFDRLVKVVVITGQSERNVALQAVGNGAYDFISKPVQVEELKIILRRAMQIATLEREYLEMAKHLRVESFEGMLGSSEQMQQVFSCIRKVATSDVPVLICGDPGSGKEMAALAIHRRSARKDGPFVQISCGSIPESVLEGELFGYETSGSHGAQRQRKGRIESAAGGTLFLDEVSELSPALQVKLLRFLQEQTLEKGGGRGIIPVDTRLVGATNADLRKRVEEGQFREDLYYKLAVVMIQLPHLCSREDDVLLLAHAFVKRFASENGKSVPPRFTRTALAALSKHKWPGNVRQLENCIRRAVIMSDGRYITEGDLGLTSAPESTTPAPRLREAREAVERDLVRRALTLHAGNISAAAEELGISRPTLYEMIEKLGIRRPETESLSEA